MSRDDHHQHADQAHAEQSTDEDLPAGGASALSLLRSVWGAKGQTSLHIEESADTGQGKHTDRLSFDGFADEVEATTDRNKAIHNLQSAWRTTLEREGKLGREGKSIRDLVLDSSDSDSDSES